MATVNHIILDGFVVVLTVLVSYLSPLVGILQLEPFSLRRLLLPSQIILRGALETFPKSLHELGRRCER